MQVSLFLYIISYNTVFPNSLSYDELDAIFLDISQNLYVLRRMDKPIDNYT